MSDPWNNNSNYQQNRQGVPNFSRPFPPNHQGQPIDNNQQQGQQHFPGPIGIAMTASTQHPGQQRTTYSYQSDWQSPQNSAAGYHSGRSQSQSIRAPDPPDWPSLEFINQPAQQLPQGSQAQPHTNPQNTGQQRRAQAQPQYRQFSQETYQGQGCGSQGQPRGNQGQAYNTQHNSDPAQAFLSDQGRQAQARRGYR